MFLIDLLNRLIHLKWRYLGRLAIASLLLLWILFFNNLTLNQFHLYRLVDTLSTVPIGKMFFLLVLGIVSVSALALYDYLLMDKGERKQIGPHFWTISFIANAFNNMLGVTHQMQNSLKLLFYRDLPYKTNRLVLYNMLASAATLTGLATFALLSFIDSRTAIRLTSHYEWLWLGIVLLAAYLIGYWFFDRVLLKYKIKDPELRNEKTLGLKFNLYLVSLLNISLSVLLFHSIVTTFAPLALMPVLAVFTVAMIAGIVSTLPAGIILFDLVAILELSKLGLNINTAAAAVLLYRFFYHIVPVVFGLITLFNHLRQQPEEIIPELKAYFRLNIFTGLQNFYQSFRYFSHIWLMLLAICGSAVLLTASILPVDLQKLRDFSGVLRPILLPLMTQGSLLLGLLLLSSVRELYYKVKSAKNRVFWLLILGAFCSLLRNLSYQGVLLLLVLAALVKLTDANLYRESIPFHALGIAANLAMGAILVLGFVNIGYQLTHDYLHALGLTRIISYHRFSGIGGATYLLFGVYLLTSSLRLPNIRQTTLFETPNLQKLNTFLTSYPGNHSTHLLFLGDKYFFWNKTGQVLIAFGKLKNTIVALGDPIGDATQFDDAIREFQSVLDLYGLQLTFYQISESNFPLYHNNGYYFFKLGEEALVDLTTFSLEGPWARSFRNVLSRFNREGYAFAVLEPPYSPELLQTLREISDEWLGNRQEKGFSLGWFSEAYLQTGPLATLTHTATGEITAFVTFMPGYDEQQVISMDLIRFKHNTLNSTMEFLLLSALQYWQKQGYHYFNLGMAPLANVGNAPNAHSHEKIGEYLYHHGNKFYSFDGLRKFKQKFQPLWQSRYLAYPSQQRFSTTVTDIALLVSSAKVSTAIQRRHQDEPRP